MLPSELFQYPLFRIVDCFDCYRSGLGWELWVSISALSDRGLLRPHLVQIVLPLLLFQYPLFRIVDCFSVGAGRWRGGDGGFQYPLFRIVDCFDRNRGGGGDWDAVSISALSDRGLLPLGGLGVALGGAVSISALSDRGLLLLHKSVQHALHIRFNIRSFGSWIASRCR